MGSNENNPFLVRPAATNPRQGGGGAAIGTRKLGGGAGNMRGVSRRALSVVNQNAVVPQPPNQGYNCAVNKRALSGDCVISDENVANPVKRPLTRNFAAQIQPTQQSSNSNLPIQTSARVEDTKIIDVEEYQTPTYQPVPMSPDQVESTASDAKMEEVEMEDVFEEPVTDIDGCDANDPLAVVDYVGDLYIYYRKMEFQGSCLVSPDYMTQQFDINQKMRAILIDWLIEVHYKFELRDETLFLTVNLIDRFLARQSVVRKKLQLVGLIALLLACKYEEVSVPIVDDLIFISDKAFTRTDILEMEKLMLNVLQFNLSVPTPYVFMRRFLKAAESDKKLERLSYFLIELALVEYEMLRFSPSLLAASAVYTAKCTLHGMKQWNRTCEYHSTYSEDQLLECAKLMVGLHQKAGTGRLTGVHRKYSTSKLGYAAKCEPAKFLLEEEETAADA